ncbi:MAG TPA: F420-dependent NADP oxidoreductase [Segetibacter sp.]|jgi:predicted short-subunit dehydrogenase-like oxidoreductase (DUF2520 family)
MKVVIIGSGNVATVLGKKISSAGHEIVEVVSRSIDHAQTLAFKLNSTASNNIKAIKANADIYLLCIGDMAIKTVAEDFPLKNKIIVHTAGAISKDVLSSVDFYGVLYPLQSLRKEMEHIPEIPVMVDGSSPEVSQTLYDFASRWASSVSFATDEERLKLHVAAVFASNFTNRIYTLTEQFCIKENVAFDSLFSLIKETALRLSQASPSTLQTGPAQRHDQITINKHLELLAAYPELKGLYTYLTNSIQNDQGLL